MEMPETRAALAVRRALDEKEDLGMKGSLIARFMGANLGPIWGRYEPGGPHVGRVIWGESEFGVP